MSTALNHLKSECLAIWDDYKKHSEFFKAVNAGIDDRRLYALLLIQTFHYTRHNAINQALVCKNPLLKDYTYMKYCLDHAQEEVGHEMMAFNDLKNLGYDISDPQQLPSPFLETDIFVAYVYHISQTGNPVQRLGYSFWAEDAYVHIMPSLTIAAQQMKLKRSNMTFFTDHAVIDKKHSEDVEKQILRMCKTNADWEDVRKVMIGTLKLTHGILESVWVNYLKLKEGHLPGYEFLEKVKVLEEA